MPENHVPIPPPASRPRAAAQRRNVDFVDQVTEKGRLGKDLGVDKSGRRLQGNGRQLVEAMEPARRMNVLERNSKDQASRQRAQDAEPASAAPPRTAADHVIALVNCFQERCEVGLGPRFMGRGHEHQREAGSLETAVQ